MAHSVPNRVTRPQLLVQRNDYQDALGAGLGVTEFAPEGKASEEIRALWGWVSKQLNREAVVHG